MIEDKKYGFEEVDKITFNDVSAFSVIVIMVRYLINYLLIYICMFILYILYVYVFEPFGINRSDDEATLVLISGILATLIFLYDLWKNVLKEKQKRYSILLTEKNNLEQRFKNIIDANPTTLKEYVVIFLANHKNDYPDNLTDFKRLLYLSKKITSKEIDDEIESYLKLLLLSKTSFGIFKSIYGYEPIYDLKLIHEFSKTYRNSYKEEDLENLNRLLIAKGIKIHDIKILKELVSEASFEYSYGLFTEYMKTETPLDEMGYIKQTINLFGNDIDYQLPFLHRFFIQHNLTSLDYKNFEEHIKTKIFELNLLSSEKQLSILDVDGMGGYEFEAFVGQLYEKMGYSVEQTPLSNDQGADLIISKYGEKTAVQVKKYTSNVSNSAVQQVVAAKKYYGCSSCSVVTNSYFTKSAIELADANGVKLVDRDELNYLINNKAIKIDQKSASAWNSKGFALTDAGRYEEAIQAYDKAIEINPRSDSAWDSKGWALRSLGRDEEAIQAYDKAIEINPRSASIWNSKGLALSSLGRDEEAIQAYDKVIEIDSKYPHAWDNKGLALSTLGRDEEAIQAYDKAIEIDPKFEGPWSSKGWALSSLGRYEEAIQAYDKAIEINPRSASIWNSKGLALSILRRYEEAIQAYDKVIEINPRSDSAWDNKGLALSSLGRYQEAIQAFDKAIEINPKSDLSWANTGYVLSSLGKYEEAMCAFDKAIEIDSMSEIAWARMGFALTDAGRYEEAIQAFDVVIEINPKSSVIWHTKGFALRSLGREEEAIQAFDRAKELGYTE